MLVNLIPHLGKHMFVQCLEQLDKSGRVGRSQDRQGEEGRLALLQARLRQFYDDVFGSSDAKEAGEARKKLEAKVG